MQLDPHPTSIQLKNLYHKNKPISPSIIPATQDQNYSTPSQSLCVSDTNNAMSIVDKTINNTSIINSGSSSNAPNSTSSNRNNQYSYSEIMDVNLPCVVGKGNFTEDEDMILKKLMTDSKDKITCGRDSIDWNKALTRFQYECRIAYLNDTTKIFYDRQNKNQLGRSAWSNYANRYSEL